MPGKQDSTMGSKDPARPREADDLLTSVAGEEDPGSAVEPPAAPVGAQPPMAPGDQAPAGTPSTGENVCPQCGGTGRLGASACPNCQGTGKVIVGIGGA
jgi:hypothetical protein